MDAAEKKKKGKKKSGFDVDAMLAEATDSAAPDDGIAAPSQTGPRYDIWTLLVPVWTILFSHLKP